MTETEEAAYREQKPNSSRDIHRLALQKTPEPAEPPQHENEEQGFDLSLLLKPKKGLSTNNNNSSSNMLGASFASQLSVLTEDEPFDESKSLNGSSWLGDADFGIPEDSEFHATMELLDKAMADLQEVSKDDHDETNKSAIEDAIENIRYAMLEGGENNKGIETINKDLDTIRSHLVTDKDEDGRNIETDNDSKQALMWETILCRLRGGTALSIYSLVAAKFQYANDFLRFGVKFVGVAILCFLAGIPRQQDMEATRKGFQVRVLFCSRKTILLLIYIVAWLSVFDISMEAWNDHQQGVVKMDNESVLVGQSKWSIERKNATDTAANSETKRFGFLKKSKEDKIVSKVATESVATATTDKKKAVEESKEEKPVKKPETKPVEKQEVKPVKKEEAKPVKEEDVKPVKIDEAKPVHKPTVRINDRSRDDVVEPKTKTKPTQEKVQPPKVPDKATADDSVEKAKQEVKKKAENPTNKAPPKKVDQTLSSRKPKLAATAETKVPTTKEGDSIWSKLLSGELMAQAQETISGGLESRKPADIVVANRKRFNFRYLLKEVVRHSAWFLVGQEDGHKSQDMLDMLGESWMHGKWN